MTHVLAKGIGVFDDQRIEYIEVAYSYDWQTQF